VVSLVRSEIRSHPEASLEGIYFALLVDLYM